MISNEEIQSWADDLTEEEPLKHALLELLAHRKAWSEPVGNFRLWDSGDEDTGPDLEWVQCSSGEPLYRKPSTD